MTDTNESLQSAFDGAEHYTWRQRYGCFPGEKTPRDAVMECYNCLSRGKPAHSFRSLISNPITIYAYNNSGECIAYRKYTSDDLHNIFYDEHCNFIEKAKGEP